MSSIAIAPLVDTNTNNSTIQNISTHQNQKFFYLKTKKATAKRLEKMKASVFLIHGKPLVSEKYVLCFKQDN